jgi:hypothetical protein
MITADEGALFAALIVAFIGVYFIFSVFIFLVDIIRDFLN